MSLPKVHEILKRAEAFFHEKGIDTPRLDAEVLLAWTLGTDRLHLYMDLQRPLTGPELDAFREAVRRRARREPVAYITGCRDFLGWDFEVSPSVLIPRPETELLVEIASKYLESLYPDWTLREVRRRELTGIAEERARRLVAESADPAGVEFSEGTEKRERPPSAPAIRFADIGTGSGIIGISLALLNPAARGILTDLSPEALAVARANVGRHGMADRLELAEGDLLDPLRTYIERWGLLDLIVANLPYVGPDEYGTLEPEITEFEPRMALVAPEAGLALIERVVAGAIRLMKPGGLLALEIGASQAQRVAEMMKRATFAEVEVRCDLAEFDRVVMARKPGAASAA